MENQELIAQRGLVEINNIDQEETIDVWASRMLELLRASQEMRDGLDVIIYFTLYKFKERWDDLPFQFRNGYKLSFEVFACRETGKRWPTVDKRIRAAGTFLGKGKGPTMGSVELPIRDEFGEADQQNPQYERIEWDAKRVPISKLTAIRSTC